MVSKKTAGRAASKVSSAAAPATSSSTQVANKSAILQSAFSPSSYQLSLFASVIQGLESDLLRIHDTVTGRLKCEHAIGSRARITCLQWGRRVSSGKGTQQNHIQKKRKLQNGANGLSDFSDVVVALGTNQSEVHLFSPEHSRVVGLLKDGHSQGIVDFKFIEDSSPTIGWSLGGDGKIVQWNLPNATILRTVSAPSPSAKTLLALPSCLLCASNLPYLLTEDTLEEVRALPDLISSIRSMIAAPSKKARQPQSFLAAAESNRHIFLYDIPSGTIAGTLLALGDIKSMTLWETHEKISETKEVLAAVTNQGEVAIFTSPFDIGLASQPKSSGDLKVSRMKTTLKPAATIVLRESNKSMASVPVIGASFEGNEIVIAVVESGLQLNFERLPWRNGSNGELLFSGLHEITKKNSSAINVLDAKTGVKDLSHSRVDDSKTVVAKGGDVDDTKETATAPEVIQISSGEEEESESEEESSADDESDSASVTANDNHTNGHIGVDEDAVMEGTSDVDNEDDDVAGEPSFGELIRAKVPEVVDVPATFPTADEQALVTVPEGQMKIPSGLSLGTVLTQSLRTNDVNLLETCLHVQDLNTIRATIERLESSLATVLLQKLAERLHSRPGRAGSLMVWVQWTLVAHGGYLASQPEVIKKLRSLHRVVKERANSLQPLLSLKGKLDMLEAQMNLRKSMQSRFGGPPAGSEDGEDGVIYVEGQAESSSDDEMDIETAGTKQAPKRLKIKQPLDLNDDGSSSDSEEDDDMPNAMEGDDTDNSGSGSEEDGFIDDEASESEGSEHSGSEDDIDHDDVDSMDEEESENEESTIRAKKPRLVNGSGLRRR